MSPVQPKINVTFPPEDNVFTGLLCESHSSPSGKVSGGVRVYLEVFSVHCTPEKSSQSLQWSQASNLCISSDCSLLSFIPPSSLPFPTASLFLYLSPGIENNLLDGWTAPQILIISRMRQCLCIAHSPCKVVIQV